METTIDSAGRVVIPKKMRDRLGLEGGESLKIRLRGDILEIEAAPTPMKLVERGGGLVAIPERELPKLTDEAVREALESGRR